MIEYLWIKYIWIYTVVKYIQKYAWIQRTFETLHEYRIPILQITWKRDWGLITSRDKMDETKKGKYTFIFGILSLWKFVQEVSDTLLSYCHIGIISASQIFLRNSRSCGRYYDFTCQTLTGQNMMLPFLSFLALQIQTGQWLIQMAWTSSKINSVFTEKDSDCANPPARCKDRS